MIEARQYRDGRNGGLVTRYGGSINGVRIPYDFETANEVRRVIRSLS